MRRLTVITLILSLSILLVNSAGADATVFNLHMSYAPDGPMAIHFDSGTRTVYAIFDYRDAEHTSLTVKVRDGAGNPVFEDAAIYNGSGHQTVAISGDDLFESYQGLAHSYATAMQEYIEQAAAAGSPGLARTLVAVALSHGIRLNSVLHTMSFYEMPPEAASHLEQALDLLDQALQEMEAIIEATPDEEVHDRIEQSLQPLVDQALDEMGQALALPGEGEERPFLDGPYTTIILIETDIGVIPVQSTEWEVSPGAAGTPTPTTMATIQPTGTFTPTLTPIHTPTPTPTPTSTPTPTPTPAPTPMEVAIPSAGDATGYIYSGDLLLNHFSGGPMWTGLTPGGAGKGTYHGAVQFDLSSIPPDAQMIAAQVELTGSSSKFLSREAGGQWRLMVLDSRTDRIWKCSGYWHLAFLADVEDAIGPALSASDLGNGIVNVFPFMEEQVPMLQERLATTGRVSFRLDYTTPLPIFKSIFAWDGGFDHHPPVLRVFYAPPYS